MVHQQQLDIRTRGRGTIDITRHVECIVADSGIRTGTCTVFVQHTSASLVITENADPDVHKDLETLLARAAPDGDREYRHHTEGPDDMAAHGRSVLTATSHVIPVGEGRLLLGTWQGIYLWEHRTAAHARSVVVTVMGDR